MARTRRRRVAYRKRHQNRLSMALVVLVVTLMTVAVALRSVELSQRLEMLAETENNLEQQKLAEEQKAEEIENFRKYTQTKRYVEEVAKDKLGLVYEGEVLFKEED